ncbi:hypothetical protein [Flaviaesturariibacter amylovorans]|uniref:Histidine kinase N-terminal 7TM region domain-containing protein n=1 Tax=Flaviaesturariibacter amylovorans TaxID=1084520 RepID=A0ABP8HNN7_9BACT
MNQALIDNTLLSLACLCALAITWTTKRRRAGNLPSFLLLFAALVVFLNMWAHCIAVALVNWNRYRSGIFYYTFAFYGQLLLGVVAILVSGFNIHHVRRHIKGLPRQRPVLYGLNAATAALFLPVIPLNPIGALPVLAAVLSTGTLVFAKVTPRQAPVATAKPALRSEASRPV